MMKGQFCYTVKRGEYVANWLVSEVQEVPFTAERVPTVFKEYKPGAGFIRPDGKERISPAKAEFLGRREFQKSGYPKNIPMEKLYLPFDTKKVDFSGFWHFPHDIRFYARVYISCKKDILWQVELTTCGGVKVWVNGDEKAEFYSYGPNNTEGKCEAVLPLQKGINEIVVGCNDYGERNIMFQFALKNILEEELEFTLPVEADVEAVTAVQKSLASMYLDKLSYSEGSVRIGMDYPFEQDVVLQVRAGGTAKAFRAEEKDGIKKLTAERESAGKILPVQAGCREIVLEEVKNFAIGYYEFSVLCEVEGVTLHTTLSAEIFPKELEQESTPVTIEERKKAAVDFIMEKTPKTIERYIAHLALGENPYKEYASCCEEAVEFIKNRGDCSDFRLARILCMLIRFGDLLTEEQKAYFKEAVLGFRYWMDEPGNDAMWFYSENHALCFHAAQLLAGELYPDEIFTNSGRTGMEQSVRAKELLAEWFENMLSHGYNEWNSACYIPIDVLGFSTLLLLCRDEEVKAYAKKAMDVTCKIFAENSFHGVMAGSSGRIYAKEILANKNLPTNGLFWLLWGIGRLNSHQVPLLFLALSDYEPPKGLLELADWKKEEAFICSRSQGVYQVPTIMYKTKDYSMASCVTPRTGGLGSQELLMNVFLKDYRTHLWVNHPGELKIYGTKRPGYFSGDALVPLVTQQKNVTVFSYQFSEELLRFAEADFTHAVVDSGVSIERQIEGNWAFIRRDNAYAALYAANGIYMNQRPPLREQELISPRVNNIWLVKTASEQETGEFEDFILWHLEHTPVKTNGKLLFEDMIWGRMEFPLLQAT